MNKAYGESKASFRCQRQSANSSLFMSKSRIAFKNLILYDVRRAVQLDHPDDLDVVVRDEQGVWRVKGIIKCQRQSSNSSIFMSKLLIALQNLIVEVIELDCSTHVVQLLIRYDVRKLYDVRRAVQLDHPDDLNVVVRDEQGVWRVKGIIQMSKKLYDVRRVVQLDHRDDLNVVVRDEQGVRRVKGIIQKLYDVRRVVQLDHPDDLDIVVRDDKAYGESKASFRCQRQSANSSLFMSKSLIALQNLIVEKLYDVRRAVQLDHPDDLDVVVRDEQGV
ncbi:hypothetical protein L2E82_18141 [Cichorium intybus]|uniref:Uncharacterized protein n=1 Tax=Cichorium intybus TaxID=13427 RepID=A0ACB9FAQ0_CICIN|nr:hypothetical protein L2E82_18141 [Cichorium intybus]